MWRSSLDAHVMPVLQRPLRIVGAVRGVAQHPAHQAQVGPAHVFAVAALHLDERLDVQLELALVGDGAHHAGEKPVQAVNQNDLVLLQPHRRGGGPPRARS